MRNIVIGSFLGVVLAAAFLVACGSGSEAQTVSVDALAQEVSRLQVTVSELASVSGCVFIRWGNTSAPPGTELLYAGYAFIGETGSGGGPSAPVVVKPGDPGAAAALTAGYHYLYPCRTNDHQNYLPPSMQADKVIRAAVCYSPTPTAVIWGTHQAPSGWRILYTGYAMGGEEGYERQTDLICVDGPSFDDSVTVAGTHGRLSVSLIRLGAGEGYDPHRYIKAAVVAKNPDS